MRHKKNNKTGQEQAEFNVRNTKKDNGIMVVSTRRRDRTRIDAEMKAFIARNKKKIIDEGPNS